MDPNKALNMTMLCDFYELTMGNGYLEHGMQDRITYFDVFFRSVPAAMPSPPVSTRSSTTSRTCTSPTRTLPICAAGSCSARHFWTI